MAKSDKVSIRPGVTVLSVLKYLEYETWFALAEFVDNSIDSFSKNKAQLRKIEGSKFQLVVKIEINDSDNKITITDNAAGINKKDYARAFRAAEIPPDNSGLSEFGMGMKSAACWFADKWSVSTSALGESEAKVVRFDMQKIFDDKLEELDVETVARDPNAHYTKIELSNVTKMPRVRGLGKVKDHLRGIYRDFIRKGILVLMINGEELHYSEPKILSAPRFDEPHGESVLWRKEVNFELSNGSKVSGFAAIREKASTSEAGFALFRRGRVIEGSFDKGFRPEHIFGNPNSFRYQRVFGELQLTGFHANFTKKGIQWDDNLDDFLNLLKKELSSKELPLLQQAEQYRVRATDTEYKAARKALNSTAQDLEDKGLDAIKDAVSSPRPSEPGSSNLAETEKTLQRNLEIRFNKATWIISIELSYDPALTELIEVGNHLIEEKTKDIAVRRIGIRLSLTHPFMVRFIGVDNSKIEPVLRIAAALGLAEILAKSSGIKTQGEVRRNFNELIAGLSKVE